VTLDPIHFIFDGSEADFIRYLRLAASGARPLSRDVQNPVAVRLADESDFKHQGRMDFVDNVVNPKTGTIRGRAIFAIKTVPSWLASSGGYACSAARRHSLDWTSAIASIRRRFQIVFTVADGNVVRAPKRVRLDYRRRLRLVRSPV
jgi:hypothetical protein